MKGINFKKTGGWLVTTTLTILVCFGLSFIFLPTQSIPQESPSITVFEEAWKTVNENFYDPNFNGVDWKAMRQKYEPLAKQAQSTQEVSVVINQMLSELNTSHTRFYTQSEPAYYQLMGIFKNRAFLDEIKKVFPSGNIEYTEIGIFTTNINDKTFITGILDSSPAAKAGLKVGDQILAIDGDKYEPLQSFKNKAGKTAEITVQRTLDSSSIQKISVIPKKLDPTAIFLEAMQSSIKIIERDGKKIGYVHVWSYAGDQYQQLLTREIAYGKLQQADGLIFDLRDGWGGAEPSYLNIFTDKVPVMIQVLRDGTRMTIDSQWRKPVVMLVNKGTRSGKEILAYGFKQYGIGSVIGTKTAGAVVGGRPFLLGDGSLLYLAVVDVFVNGERLEGKGVIPDIEVPFQLEYAQGADPQQEKAIEVLLGKV